MLGCGGDIKISIYTRDLSEVADSKENIIYTNANMIVESLDDEKDIEFLRQNLNGFSNEHAVQYNYSTSLSFDIKVPIVSDENSINFSKDLLSLICKKNNDEINCYLKYNKNLIEKLGLNDKPYLDKILIATNALKNNLRDIFVLIMQTKELL